MRLLAEKLDSFSRRRPCLFSDGAFVRNDDDRDPGVRIAAGHCRTCDPSSAAMTLLGLDPSEPLDQTDLRRDLVSGQNELSGSFLTHILSVRPCCLNCSCGKQYLEDLADLG